MSMDNPPHDPTAPTEVFVAPPAATEVFAAPTEVYAAAPPPQAEPKRSKLPFILLGVLGALLLISVGLIVGLLLSGGNDQPAAVPTPTVSETPEPEPEPEPAPLAVITSFTVTPTIVDCVNESAGTTAAVTLSWTVTDAEKVALARGTEPVDALEDAAGQEVDAEQTDFGGVLFDCTLSAQVYSLTAENIDGDKVTESVTVDRNLLPPPVAAPHISEVAWTNGFDYVICASFDNGLTEEKGVKWASSPGVNSVTLFLAQDDSGYPTASSHFTQVASGLPANGSYPVNINCGTSGYSTYFAVKVVAQNQSGRAEKLIAGNTAS